MVINTEQDPMSTEQRCIEALNMFRENVPPFEELASFRPDNCDERHSLEVIMGCIKDTLVAHQN